VWLKICGYIKIKVIAYLIPLMQKHQWFSDLEWMILSNHLKKGRVPERHP
jgi:hypothetical protein